MNRQQTHMDQVYVLDEWEVNLYTILSSLSHTQPQA